MYFFFYGTLLAGSTNPVAAAIHRKLEPRGLAWVAGALYAVPDPCGWYPALLDGADRVYGMLYAARSGFSEQDLAALDAYEEFDPSNHGQSLYIRAQAAATGVDGAGLEAQVYRFNRALPTGSRRIDGGDFRAWLDQHGEQAFDALRGG